MPESKGPISVLMISSSFYPKIGGTERQAELLARALQKIGVDVEVIALQYQTDLLLEENASGLRITRISYPHWKIAGMVVIMGKLFLRLYRRRKEYDIIHVHMVGYLAFIATLAAKCLGKPILLKFALRPSENTGAFGDFPEFVQRRPVLKKILLWGVGKSDRFIAVSRSIESMALAAGLPRDRVKLIPNAVNIELYSPALAEERKNIRKDLKFRAGPAVVFCGRLIPRKGLADLLLAWKTVRDKYKEATLYLLGTGKASEEMVALAGTLGIKESVQFEGLVENVSGYMRGADLFVLPSHYEGMPNTLLEAMACGLPVVATSVSGVVDLVRDGINGVLIGPGRPDSLADAIIQTLDNPAGASRFGRAARETIQTEYSIGAVARAYFGLYQQLLGEKRLSKG